jgi:hypothetical protein
VPGQGYQFVRPLVYAGGRYYSGIHLRIDFFEPLPLYQFGLVTHAPGHHTLMLHATDGTVLVRQHTDGWETTMGWLSYLSEIHLLQDKLFTHAEFVSGWSIPNVDEWTDSYIREVWFTLRSPAQPYPTATPSMTPTPTCPPAGPDGQSTGGGGVCVQPTPTPSARIPNPSNCPVQAAYYANQAIDINLLSTIFQSSDAQLKHDCLAMYRNLIAYVVFHELAALHVGPYFVEGDMYSAYVLLNRLYEPTWQTAETITLEELAPFQNMFAGDSVYYLFVRTMINGISLNILTGEEPIANYFGANFNSSLARVNDCGGQLKVELRTQAGRPFEPVCAYLPFWDSYGPAVTQPDDGTWRQEFGIYALPEIDRAIHDAAFHIPNSSDAFSDPTDGAIGARPVNRLWTIDHPNAPSNAFVFRTYLDRIIFYTWANYTSSDGRNDYVITAPVIRNADGTARSANQLDETASCLTVNETLAQSFMRNLFTIYWDSAYQALPAFPDPQRQYYLPQNVRFGMGGDSAGLYSRSAHGLVVEGQSVINSDGIPTALPFSLSRTNPVGNMGAISWQTYRFTRPLRDGDPNITSRNPIVVPINGAEALPIEEGVPRVEPVVC